MPEGQQSFLPEVLTPQKRELHTRSIDYVREIQIAHDCSYCDKREENPSNGTAPLFAHKLWFSADNSSILRELEPLLLDQLPMFHRKSLADHL